MGGMSIDGLVTGLDTSTLIRQLMQAERAPQRQLIRQEARRHPGTWSGSIGRDSSRNWRSLFSAAGSRSVYRSL